MTCGVAGDRSIFMTPLSSSGGGSGFRGNTRHTLPLPEHPSSSNIFQRSPNCGLANLVPVSWSKDKKFQQQDMIHIDILALFYH